MAHDDNITRAVNQTVYCRLKNIDYHDDIHPLPGQNRLMMAPITDNKSDLCKMSLEMSPWILAKSMIVDL